MSDLPNPRKGEATVVIGEDEYLLRYTFRNLVKIQKATGKNGKQIFEALGCLDMEMIAIIVHEGIKLGGSWPERFGKKAPNLDQVMDEMCFQDVGEYAESIMSAFNGAEFVEGKKKAQEQAEDQDQ